MRKFFALLTLVSLALTATGTDAQQTGSTAATAQTPPAAQGTPGITPNRVSGEVTAIDAAAKTITVKADGSSALVTIMLNEKTSYLRAKPEATSKNDMGSITLADISVGDRVVALGKVSDDQKSVPARVVISMTKTDVAKKQEHDREEWKRRGIVGNITAIDPTTKEITVSVRSREGAKPIVVAATDKVVYRRYAPDSVKFADAKPGTFADLKVGDQVRALGNKSEDGTRFMPEEIVSGSFRQVLGTVTAVNAATNEITVTTPDKKTLSIVVNNDSLLRRLPPFMAQMMAQRGQGGGGAGMGAAGNGGAQRSPAGGEGARPPAVGAGGAQTAGGGAAAGGPRRMGGGGGFDVQDMLERMPPLTVAELKPGDMILVSSTAGADPTRVTAIAVVAGVDAIINAMQGQGRNVGAGAAAGANLGLPGGIDLGIGLP